jgi:hypothetical protein
MVGIRPALDWRYSAFLIALAIVLLSGFLLQDVPSGAVVAGVRAHLMFIPFFLLPAVYRFSERQIRIQFCVLMGLLFMQVPVAVYQRFIEYAGSMETGDVVRGTATTSSALSLLMMGAIAACITLYLRRRIGVAALAASVVLLFIPTTLNETKATLALLPLAFLIPALCTPRGYNAIRRLLPVAAVGALAAIAFVGVYNYLIQFNQTGQPLGELFSNGRLAEYLYAESADREVNYIGRFDSIVFAWDGIGRDPRTFVFGLGAGNVSTSFLSQFDGEYAAYYERYGVGMTQLTTFLWEVGVAGLLAYLFLYYLLWRDARFLARGEGQDALVGQIWVTVTVIMGFGLIYKSVFSMTEIGYLFWYFSGVVVSRVVEARKPFGSGLAGEASRRSAGPRAPSAWRDEPLPGAG